MENILIIVYHFPPMGGGAVLRTQKFVKYLPQFGLMPTVVTANIPASIKDDTLLEELDKRIEIFRTITFEKFGIEKNLNEKIHENKKAKRTLLLKLLIIWKFFKNTIVNNFFIPDKYVGWTIFAYKKCKEIIKKQQIDMIYSSSPPVSTHLVAYLLKCHEKIPWVMDYRDLWLNHNILGPKTKFSKFINNKVEKKFISRADKVISATTTITEDFIDRYKKNNKFITITNGYDKERFDNNHISKYKTKNKFTIVYSGSFSNYQTPEYFLIAIKELLLEYNDFKSDIEIIFAGSVEKNHLVSSIVNFIGFIPYKDAVDLICSADVLLLTIYELQCSKSVLTTKLFDYIGAQKPILALIPSGIASEMIKDEKLGVVVSPNNIQDIKRAILGLYMKWKEKKLYTGANYSMLAKKFDRKQLTYELSKVLKEVVNHKK
ncbi:MAG: glycosyltransferase family 4 protein [bacterium]|nr:glycosyltransferase family 4 protein [bacterium]